MRYPHTLTIIPASTSTQDANGDFTEVEATDEPVVYQCRAESSDSNGIIKSVDGSLINYNWIVYLPLSSLIIPVGTTVSIDLNGLQVNDNVKRFAPGQYNNRLWL
jgi:hypothetical protein